MPAATSVINPNLGLYLDRPAIALAPRMLQAGENFRIKEGKLSNLNLGWTRLGSSTLNGSVRLIDTFTVDQSTVQTLLATTTDIYKLNPSDYTVTFLTPRYQTGTASVSGTAVTGIGTLWLANAKAGDEIHFGAANYVTSPGTWYTIQSVDSDLGITLTASAGVIGAGAYTIRKKFTGSATDLWQTETFINASPSGVNEWWATNGVDDIVRWNGTDTQVEVMSSLNLKARSLRVYDNMMIFGDVTQSGSRKPTDIVNSNAGEPQNVSSGLSEQYKVHGGSDRIMRLYQIGQNLAIYSERSIVVAQFVGGDLGFVFNKITSTVGLIAPNGIADMGAYHKFMGPDTQYTFDGVNVREADNHVWREIIRQQDPSRITLSKGHFDEENGDILWVVPSTSDTGSGTATSAPSRAFVEHYLEDIGNVPNRPYSKRSFPFTAMGYFKRTANLTWDQLTDQWSNYNFRWNDQFFFASFPLTMVGDANGKIYTLSTAQDADGTALASYVRFGRKAVGDGRIRGLVSRVYPFFSKFVGSEGYVTTYMSDHAGGPASISERNDFSMDLTEGSHFVTPYRRGRFTEIEFGSDGPAQPWELAGYDIDVRVGGKR